MNCPECDHEFSPKEVASMLGSLSLGVQKTLSDGERLRRSEAMTAMNKNKKPTVKSVPAKKIPSKNQPGVAGERPAEFAGSRSVKEHPESPGAEEKKPAAKELAKEESMLSPEDPYEIGKLFEEKKLAIYLGRHTREASARKADDPMKRMFAKIPMAAKPDEDFRFKPQTK